MTLSPLLARIEEGATRRPEQVVLRDAVLDREMTYPEVVRAAKKVAAGLRARDLEPGARVILMYSAAGLDFAAAILGCFYAGCVPVPVTPIGRQRSDVARLEHIVSDCSAVLAMSAAEESQTERAKEASALLRSLEWCAPARWDLAPREDERSPRQESATAFIQYTSGSTSDPRGVVVTHDALAANLETIASAMSLSPSERCVSWLPLHHDMGLVGSLFGALWSGTSLHMLTPRRFVADPLGWLRTISQTKSTVSGGPTFAYRMCADRARNADLTGLDLRSWRVAFCGSEPIDARTIERFCDAFAPYGFDPRAFFPCYGMAEATLFISGRSNPDEPWAVKYDDVDTGEVASNGETSLVSCGTPQGCDIQIVSAEGAPCGAREIGEIWVSGPSMARDYFGKPEQSAALLQAKLKGDPRPWVRTGDLGFLDHGLLFVTGREKELIIVAGRNIYPQDIERTVRDADAAVLTAAAFEVEHEGAARAVCLVELDPRAKRKGLDVDGLQERLRHAVSQQDGVAALIEFVPTRTIQKTSSGKVRRGDARREYAQEQARRDFAARCLVWTNEAPAPTAPDAHAWAATVPLCGRHKTYVVFGEGELAKVFATQLLREGASSLHVHPSVRDAMNNADQQRCVAYAESSHAEVVAAIENLAGIVCVERPESPAPAGCDFALRLDGGSDASQGFTSFTSHASLDAEGASLVLRFAARGQHVSHGPKAHISSVVPTSPALSSPAAQDLSAVEAQVLKVVESQLGSRVSVDANFYEMGIDSITVTQIMNEISESYGLDVGIADVADALSIRDISVVIERRLEAQLDLLSDEQIEALLHAQSE